MEASEYGQHVVIEAAPGSEKLFVIFGGLAGEVVLPPFEFYQTAKILNHSKIFLRDPRQNWYQNGVVGIGNDIVAVRKAIEYEIVKYAPKKVVWVGNSMGGFAAILFSKLVGTGRVVAFSPQTFISPVQKILYRDTRWMRELWETYRRSFFKTRVLDLQPFLKKYPDRVEIEIHVSKNLKKDYFHACRLRRLRGVQLYEYDYPGHDLVRFLRDRNELAEILNR